MAVTTNGTPTDAWSLVYSAAGDATVSISCRMHDLEVVNHNSGSTPPAASIKSGHDCNRGEVLVVSVVSGDHLWQRIRPSLPENPTPVIVVTVQAST